MSDKLFMTETRTVLIGNTSFRTEVWRGKETAYNKVTFKDVAPNPHKREDDIDGLARD